MHFKDSKISNIA